MPGGPESTKKRRTKLAGEVKAIRARKGYGGENFAGHTGYGSNLKHKAAMRQGGRITDMRKAKKNEATRKAKRAAGRAKGKLRKAG